jgi:hypothetical protein
MADMSTKAPITIRRHNLPRPSFPRLGFGASLAAMSGLVADALKMAYVEPYTTHRRRPQVVPDDDLDGRDPTW